MQEPLTDRLLSGEDLLALGDIGPAELIDGRIVSMTPAGGRHGLLEIRLAARLATFVESRDLGWVLVGEVGIFTRRGPDRVRGADIAVISRSRLPAGPGERYLTVAPELIVEILSPTDRWGDVRSKLEEYFAIGVERVWIVEPDNRTVLVFVSPMESRRLTEDQNLEGDGVLTGFSIPLSVLFAG